MDDVTRDVLDRAARLSRLELAASLLGEEPSVRRRDLRALLGAALALLLALYPGMSAAAPFITAL